MKLRKRPVVLDGVQWFKMGDHPAVAEVSHEQFLRGVPSDCGFIDTLEGGHIVSPGDWIMTGLEGEHWPVKPHIKMLLYEDVKPARSGWHWVVLEFAVWMIDRFVEKDSEGRQGHEHICESEYQERAIKNIKERHYVDAANLCVLASRRKHLGADRQGREAVLNAELLTLRAANRELVEALKALCVAYIAETMENQNPQLQIARELIAKHESEVGK
jgi:hypothetical protein